MLEIMDALWGKTEGILGDAQGAIQKQKRFKR